MGENVSNIEINEVVLVHCNIVNNDYQQDSKVLHMFVPNKSFGQVLEFSLLKYDLLIKVLNCQRQKIKKKYPFKVMFILSSVSSGLELQLVNHTSIYEDTKSKDFKNIKVLDEISNY